MNLSYTIVFYLQNKTWKQYKGDRGEDAEPAVEHHKNFFSSPGAVVLFGG